MVPPIGSCTHLSIDWEFERHAVATHHGTICASKRILNDRDGIDGARYLGNRIGRYFDSEGRSQAWYETRFFISTPHTSRSDPCKPFVRYPPSPVTTKAEWTRARGMRGDSVAHHGSDRRLSVTKCLDDPDQPHLNARGGVLVLARVRGHVQENGRTNSQKGCLRYLNQITF